MSGADDLERGGRRDVVRAVLADGDPVRALMMITDAERRLLYRFCAYLRSAGLEVCRRTEQPLAPGWRPIDGGAPDLLGAFAAWRARQDAEQQHDLAYLSMANVLVKAVYEASASWPRAEVYGLTDQARRAAVSIPANIAEGQGRQGKAEFLHYLSMANGSVHELETHLYIAGDLGYLSETARDALLEHCAEVGRLLNGLMRSLRP